MKSIIKKIINNGPYIKGRGKNLNTVNSGLSLLKKLKEPYCLLLLFNVNKLENNNMITVNNEVNTAV